MYINGLHETKISHLADKIGLMDKFIYYEISIALALDSPAPQPD